MLGFSSTNLQFPPHWCKGNFVLNPKSHLGFRRNGLFFPCRSLSKSLYEQHVQRKKHSFTISCMVTPSGFFPESAEYAFEDCGNPKFIGFLRSYGFTDKQISKLVTTQPCLISAKLEKTCLPKIEFLLSIGVPNSSLGSLLSVHPQFFLRSLEEFIVPTYTFLKDLFTWDDGLVLARSLLRLCRTSMLTVVVNLSENISVLKEFGVPPSVIFYFVANRPTIASYEPSRFSLAVKWAIEIGINTRKFKFVDAVEVLAGPGCRNLEHKLEVYKRFGLSTDEIWSAFKISPSFMCASEKKIMSIMDFLINKMAWQPADVMKSSYVLQYSLAKRIVPRCSVIRVLQLKGLLERKINLTTVVNSPDKYFIPTFVIKYEEKIPQLWSIFQGEKSILELGYEFEDKKEVVGRKGRKDGETEAS